MPTIPAAYWRDANRIPITTDGIITTDTQTFTGSNTTVAVPIFTVAGMIECRGIWANVTTTIGVNHTAAYWRLNDGTAQSDITLSTGTAISGAAVGSDLVKKGLAAAALTLLTSAQERVSEPTTLETFYFSPFTLNGKNAVTTNIEYVYTTTDTPTTGAMTFFLRWLPLTIDANVTAL